MMLQSLRVFWVFNREVLGLSLAVAIAAVVVLFLSPVGPSMTATGRVVSFGVVTRGSKPVAFVQVGDLLTSIPQRQGEGCEIGSEVPLTRQKRLIGWTRWGVSGPCRSGTGRPDAAAEM